MMRKSISKLGYLFTQQTMAKHLLTSILFNSLKMQHCVSPTAQTRDWKQIHELTIQGPLLNCRRQHYIEVYVAAPGNLFMKIQDECLLPKLCNCGRVNHERHTVMNALMG